MPSVKWHDREEALLFDLAGTCQMPEIISRLHKLEGVLKLPLRSENAIRTKLAKHGLSAVPEFDHFPMASLARRLNIGEWVIENWINHGLEAKKLKSGNYSIKLKSVYTFAKKYPKEFYRFDRSLLEWIFDDDKDFVVSILELKKSEVKVVDLAKALGRSTRTVRRWNLSTETDFYGYNYVKRSDVKQALLARPHTLRNMDYWMLNSFFHADREIIQAYWDAQPVKRYA